MRTRSQVDEAQQVAEAQVEPHEYEPAVQTVSPMTSLYDGTNAVPRTPFGTVLHVGIKEGDVASRVLSVGCSARAARVAAYLEGAVIHKSQRGFTTYTGSFEGVAMTIISIGMGLSMMDFMCREVRQCVTGPMLIVRFGTCGTLQPHVPVGSIVVACEGSIKVIRNPDAFLPDASPEDVARPYITFRPQPSDHALSATLVKELSEALGADVIRPGLNVSADSFYSSQGRQDALFDDRNESVLDQLRREYPTVSSMEMESFQLLTLANASRGAIRASAASIVVANRPTGVVCEEGLITRLELHGGKAVLRALKMTPLQ